jgi:hypothetical protein
MNHTAERHLAQAATYIGRGDEFYWKAGEEILAAQQADPTLSLREAARRISRSEKWVRTIVRHVTTAEPGSQLDWERGSHATAAEIREGAEKLLREAPAEQVEQIVASLPADRQVILGAAVGDAYSISRREFDEEELALPPAQRKEREAAQGKVSDHVGRAMAGLDTFGIVNHLGQATSILSRMIAEDALTEEYMQQVDAALSEFLGEYRVAMAKVEEVV